MVNAAPTDGRAPDPDVLLGIAESVRGSFQTVEDMAQSFIREAIHQGAFPPGQRLNLDTIAATLGISRMPVRASLRQLESEGLLRIHPYRGATVSVLRPEEIAEIYDMRVLLECYLLEHAIGNLDDGALAALESIVADLEKTDELGVRLEKRRQFYRTLYERAQRPRTLAQVDHLRGSVGRYLLLQRVDEHHGHEDLMGYLRAHDVDAAKAWLTTHLGRVSAMLQEIVRADQDSAEPIPRT
jgi:DNA-binding GntR family transcriptional regulator